MSGRPHGYARYRLDRCRCYICAFARSEYDANRDRAIAYGTWKPYVDAEPVRRHIRSLQECGVGLRRIAEIAGVDRKRLQNVLYGRPERGTGPQEKVRPALAEAVLKVEATLDNLGSATIISAVGSQRRLQALMVAGWPQSHLAAHLGLSDNFAAFFRRDHTIVRTARAIRTLYDELWNVDPRTAGVAAQPYARAMNRAKAEGWYPAGAWDDDTIDDPAATPDMGDDVDRWKATGENTDELLRQDFTYEQAAKRLGVLVNYARESHRRWTATREEDDAA